jgi:hypothetical protein
VLEGQKPDTRYPLPEEFRDWQLVKKFGWTKDQIDAQPAAWLDWILQIDGAAIEAEIKAQSRG